MEVLLDQVDSGFYDVIICNASGGVVAWKEHVPWNKVLKLIKKWRHKLLVT